jgi:hypothetical protein
MLLYSTQGKPKVAGTHVVHAHVTLSLFSGLHGLLCHSAGTNASVYAVKSLFSSLHGHVILLCHSAGTIASVYAVESLFSGMLRRVRIVSSSPSPSPPGGQYAK